MSSSTTTVRAAGIAGALAIVASYLTRPFVRDYLDSAALATSIADHTGRWVASALLLPAGYAAVAIAFHALAPRSLAGPAMGLASALLGVQAGAVVGAGAGGVDAGDAAASVEAIRGWEGPLIGAVLILSALAWVAFARHAGRALPTRGRRVFLGAACALAIGGLLVPSSAGEYVSAVGVAAAMWAVVARSGGTTPSVVAA